MKKLIAKIREILRNRRVRKLWTRIVSSIACLVVFVTTYALVLPAITMESQASCGIEAHQHNDSCYEERLTCTIPESDGHTHTEDCYSTKQKLICDRSEHEHNSDCYDENGNLTCSLEEHQHGRECFEETRELVCGLEEAEGHHHDSSCYEKILTCGKEAHTHSQACYREDAASAVATEHAAVTATTTDSGDGSAAADVNGADGSSDDFETLDPAQTPSESNVPAPDELDLQQPLNSDTAISNDSPAVDETRGSGNSDAGIISDDSSSAEENITEAVEETHPGVSFEDTLTVYTGSLGSDITGSLSSDTNAGNPGNDAAVSPDTDTAAGTLPASSNMTVSVSAEAGTFPAGTTMVLSAVTDMDAVAEAVEGTVDSKTRGFQAVDISFRDKDGNEIEPLKPISVTMRSDSIKAATEDSSMAPVVVHVEDRNKETAEATDSPAATVIETLPDTAENKEQSETLDATNSPDAISFEADAFSVYAIVYTVDFEYSVNGKMYQFSLPGGGFVSFTDLVEVLGIIGDTNFEKNGDENGSVIAENAEENVVNEGAEEIDVNSDTNTSLTLGDVEVSEATRKFVEDVASVEFSSPELVDVSRVEAEITVGQIKKSRGLECEYSAELTEEQMAEINAQTVNAGDWALISVQSFTSEETLTVTMKDGEVFTVKVTDAQITTMFLSDSGKLFEVTVTYDQTAHIPEGSTLRVTEFSEDDEEYEYARNAVLADKKARVEWVDLSSFGLAALDISIINPDGEEIEPEAPVQVEILIKELPGVEDLSEVEDTLAIQHHVEVEDGVVVETVFDGNTDASFKMETNEKVAAEGVAVEPESVSQEDFGDPGEVDVDGLNIAFEATAFSTFTVSWRNNNRKVTVHYVDENGRELTISNSNNIYQNLNADSTSPAYLIYDIDGYEYSYCYRNQNTNSNRISPLLAKNVNNRWMYNVSRSGYYDYYGNFYYYIDNYGNVIYDGSEMSNGDNIYVVYKKKNDIVQGGKPTVKQSGDVTPPVDPRINKTSTPNGDDTNTLALSLISDTAALEVEKLADVIVVFDVSGSMSTSDMGGNTTRLQAAKNAVNSLATELAKKKNSAGEPLVRMSLIEFSTKASPVIGLTDLTNDGVDTFKRKVNGLTANGGTNWDHALQLANEENDLDSGRATFVIFVTDGDPTFRNTRMNVTDQELQGETNDTSLSGGWLNPNGWYLSDNVYGPGDNDKTGKCYEAAVEEGLAIRTARKNLYTIGISNSVTKVSTFNTAVGGNGAYLAENQSALQQAFSDIEASISGASGWGNIQMTDGITNLTNTVQKTGLTNVGGDFTYWKAPAPDNWASMTDEEKNAYKPATSAFVPLNLESEGISPAVYNEDTGAVEWNMGSTFMPEAGVTYQVRFKVWPSQEAYDYIAKLNNGTIQYDTLPQTVRDQISKDGNNYTLKTNEPHANTTYQSATRTGDTVTASGKTYTLEFPTVKDLNLSVDKMKVEKKWVNDLDPDARWKSDVTLLLTDGAGNLYKSIPLNEENGFSAEDNFISCGLAKTENGELIIYEQGHDFKLTEPENYAYYWDLDSQIYRPMVINATLTMLIKTDTPPDMGNHTYYEYQGTKYYKIGDGTYKTISTGDAAATITATNIRRSNLNLTKIVVDEEGNPVISSDLFTFTITINDAKDDDVWFSVQKDANDTDTIVKELSTNATSQLQNGEKTGYYYAHSGSSITVSMEPGWNLRFTNLPNGTTYTITENAIENYTFVKAEIDNNGTLLVNSDTATASGTINKSNTQYTVTYTNSAKTQQIKILKTGQDGSKPLPGAVFSLYTQSGYESDPKQAAKTDLTSNENGQIDLGKLAYGTYYLVETSAPAGYILLSEPVVITVAATGVTYTQEGSNLPLSGNGVIHQNETDPYILTVTNNAGYELPSTGGPGTRLFTILGSFLILGAGALLWRRRRFI